MARRRLTASPPTRPNSIRVTRSVKCPAFYRRSYPARPPAVALPRQSLHLLQQLPRLTQQGLDLLSLGDRIPGEQALRALLLPLGGPEPDAPPCMRQRFLPRTAG